VEVDVAERKVLDMRVAGPQCKTPEHPRVRPPQVQDVVAKIKGSVCSIESNAVVQEALQRMKDSESEAVVVTEHGRLVGIASEGDCARAAIDLRCAKATNVSDIMTPCRISASIADSLYQCLRVMEENHTRYLPVLDGDQPIALISREQVLSELVVYLERVFHEHELDKQIVFLRGTYSC
jgi:signal-transduction protein with cAMP-binding, CBS, and nucleotidyltransferase domain